MSSKKIISAFILFAFALIALASCDLLGNIVGNNTASLPEPEGAKTVITKESAVELYDELMSYGSGGGVPNYQSVIDRVKDANAFSTPATVEQYVNYVAQCERSTFENGGSVNLDDGTSATLMFGASDGETLLVVHRDGVMYVILLVMDIEPEPAPEWPTDEEFAKFHIQLDQAEGTLLKIVTKTDKSIDTFADCDSLYVDMDNATRVHYNAYINEAKKQGFVLDPHGDEWEGQENYIAYKTVDKLSFGCEVRIIDGNRVCVRLWNETQNIQRDTGILLSDLWDKGTFVVRNEYMHTPEDEPSKEPGTGDASGKNPENEKTSGEPYLRVDYTVSSFSDRGYAEFWQQKTEDFELTRDFIFRDFGSEIFDYSAKKIYRLYNYGKNKLGYHENPGFPDNPKHDATDEDEAQRFFYSIERHVSARGSTIGANYALATNLHRTGKTNIIAGIECAEYTAVCVVVDGDNVITWDATFNVWEEYNIALSYSGQRWWSDPTPYYEEYVLITRDAWIDDALDLPYYGEYTNSFPGEDIGNELGFSLPEVEGALGYFVEIVNRSETGDAAPLLKNVYHAGGVSHTEYLDYREELKKLGFIIDDEWTTPYMYREADNAKITVSMIYYEESQEIVFEVSVEKTPEVTLPAAGTYRMRYVGPSGEAREAKLVFFANGDVLTEDSYGNRTRYTKTGNYVYTRHNGSTINKIHIMSEIGSTFSTIAHYTEDWGLTYVKKGTVGSLPVAFYESWDGIIEIAILEESGFILHRTDSGSVTVELIGYTADTSEWMD